MCGVALQSARKYICHALLFVFFAAAVVYPTGTYACSTAVAVTVVMNGQLWGNTHGVAGSKTASAGISAGGRPETVVALLSLYLGIPTLYNSCTACVSRYPPALDTAELQLGIINHRSRIVVYI